MALLLNLCVCVFVCLSVSHKVNQKCVGQAFAGTKKAKSKSKSVFSLASTRTDFSAPLSYESAARSVAQTRERSRRLRLLCVVDSTRRLLCARSLARSKRQRKRQRASAAVVSAAAAATQSVWSVQCNVYVRVCFCARSLRAVFAAAPPPTTRLQRRRRVALERARNC